MTSLCLAAALLCGQFDRELAIDPLVDARGNFGVLTLNSGLYRGPDGLTQFFGSRARPDDAIAVRTITIDSVVPGSMSGVADIRYCQGDA